MSVAIQYDLTRKSYIVTVTLFIHKNYGVIGIDPKHTSGDLDYMDTSFWEDEMPTAIRIEHTLVIPEALFDPYKINVTIPPEFIAPDLIKNSITQIEVPVNLGDVNGELVIEDRITEGKHGSFLTRLKKAIIVGWETIKSDT